MQLRRAKGENKKELVNYDSLIGDILTSLLFGEKLGCDILLFKV